MKLRQLGKMINRFIAAVEQEGAAAKICGAGACDGDNAGVVMIMAEDDVALARVRAIVADYGYELLEGVEEASGVRII